MVGGLALQIGIVGFVPAHDFVGQVVEDEIATVRAHRQHGMAFTIRLADNGNQEIGERNACLMQFALLEKDISSQSPTVVG
ncbi:hypothetical protein C064_01756 [Brucella suis 63/252]|nr:hypothetical protein DK67_236 [Brucella suis bv. 3 str. 686]AIJ82677.1 hypothetical protein DK60_65 [Brucella canis]AIJ99036.1 hypothetical protein DO76_501 [Brucella suis]ENQ58470.1 hypothetical protein C969_01957 [Brucella canis CNGB 1172]ENQ61110.1 hypothetical protein C979_01487 [Brucella canis UK10/02]ENR17417.1 hypothetical protein C064_01756 [Brucella suis 63/252]ENS47301.1 hypothetical protein B976_01490 [Brucella canis 79/122]ENS50858.1 hypothetical protein C968_01937 [Brucella c